MARFPDSSMQAGMPDSSLSDRPKFKLGNRFPGDRLQGTAEETKPRSQTLCFIGGIWLMPPYTQILYFGTSFVIDRVGGSNPSCGTKYTLRTPRQNSAFR